MSAKCLNEKAGCFAVVKKFPGWVVPEMCQQGHCVNGMLNSTQLNLTATLSGMLSKLTTLNTAVYLSDHVL